MLYREILIEQIISIFASMSNEIEERNRNNLLDINIFNENFYINLLNLVFNIKLRNANSIKKNYPAVDCIDETNRIAFQITSNSSKPKVQNSINLFVKNNLHLVFNLNVFISTKKQLKNHYKDLDTKGITFSYSNIIDYRTIIDELNQQTTSLDKIKKVYDYLQTEYTTYKNQEDNREKYFKEIDDNLVSLKTLSHRPFFHFFVHFSAFTGLVFGIFLLFILQKTAVGSALAMFCFFGGTFIVLGSLMYGIATIEDKDMDKIRGINRLKIESVIAEVEKSIIQAERNIINSEDYILNYQKKIADIDSKRDKDTLISIVAYLLYLSSLIIIYYCF